MKPKIFTMSRLCIFLLLFMSCNSNKNNDLLVPDCFKNKMDFISFIRDIKMKMSEIKGDVINCEEKNDIFRKWINDTFKIKTPFAIYIRPTSEECSLSCSHKFKFEDLNLINPKNARDSIISERLLVQNDTLTLYEVHYKVNATLNGETYDRVWFISDEDDDKNLEFVVNFLYKSKENTNILPSLNR